MKRIDTIYETIKKGYSGQGFTAQEIGSMLSISRANASSDLNRLVAEGRILKKKGKPVLFALSDGDTTEIMESALDAFSKHNPSLHSAVEQAKAAVMYPPNGMGILLLGETGTGKSMFAQLVYDYAKDMERIDQDAPFIVFNCADYASNPQLLLAQIFGTKKGAFTGALEDKPGLIEKADGGFLFLDEVHRLPPEGQEMFFTFIDKGIYRRLGETDMERRVKVQIISATTENPEVSLLKTFTRRIPMVIRITSLKERGLEERFNLVCKFFTDESLRLDKEIRVSVNSMKALSSYTCPNNIGQLRTDIQLCCAKAYIDYMSGKKEIISLSTIDLPPYIRQGLYAETEHRQLWNKLTGINSRYFMFQSQDNPEIIKDYTEGESIYDLIDLKLHELKGSGIKESELEDALEKSIEEYFKSYIHSVSKNREVKSLESIISPEIISVVNSVVDYCEETLEMRMEEKIYYGLAVHIANSIAKIRGNQRIVSPRLSIIRSQHKKEFNCALNALKIIEGALDVPMPIEEAGYIAMFLVYDQASYTQKERRVKIIVVAHGSSTATSMAETANTLLGETYAIGINAPLDEKPAQIIESIKNFIKNSDIRDDILFLVDMGSLTSFGEELEAELGIRTKTIPLVSTLHVLESTRKAILGYSLTEVYEDTLNVNTLLSESNPLKPKENENKLAIITVCTTGEGGAVAAKKLIFEKLNMDKKLITVIPINYTDKKETMEKIQFLSKEYRIIFIISPFSLPGDFVQFGLDALLSEDGTEILQNHIDQEVTYVKMGYTLENQLQMIDGFKVLNDIKQFNRDIEEELSIRMPTDILIGVTFHSACMIDRLLANKDTRSFRNKKLFITSNRPYYLAVRKASLTLMEKYDIDISDDDVCRIMTFFMDNKNNLN